MRPLFLDRPRRFFNRPLVVTLRDWLSAVAIGVALGWLAAQGF